MTLTDGNSAPGEFGENDLTLALGGIVTGIRLNGYRIGQTDTRTNSGDPANGRGDRRGLARRLWDVLLERFFRSSVLTAPRSCCRLRGSCRNHPCKA